MAEAKAGYKAGEQFEVLNEDESILVLVDEAHRTQAGDLHANLLAGLPNCARIGFTGTPILMGDKKRTHEIFGEFIDRYTINEAEADGATCRSSTRAAPPHGAVKDGASLDELFEDLFREHTPEELEAIKRKYATKGQIFEAPDADRATRRATSLRHYVTNILPNGYKAQVVAYSRLAVMRYFEALKRHATSCWPRPQALSPGGQGAGRRGPVPAPARGAGAGAGLALPRDAGPHRVRAHHLGQQQRRPGLEDSGPTARRRSSASSASRSRCCTPTRPRPTRWPS